MLILEVFLFFLLSMRIATLVAPDGSTGIVFTNLPFYIDALCVWITGLLFSFCFGYSVNRIRKRIRPGALWLFRNPEDPDFRLLHEIRSGTCAHHLRRFLATSAIYSVMVTCTVVLPVMVARALFLPPVKVDEPSSAEYRFVVDVMHSDNLLSILRIAALIEAVRRVRVRLVRGSLGALMEWYDIAFMRMLMYISRFSGMMAYVYGDPGDERCPVHESAEARAIRERITAERVKEIEEKGTDNDTDVVIDDDEGEPGAPPVRRLWRHGYCEPYDGMRATGWWARLSFTARCAFFLVLLFGVFVGLHAFMIGACGVVGRLVSEVLLGRAVTYGSELLDDKRLVFVGALVLPAAVKMCEPWLAFVRERRPALLPSVLWFLAKLSIFLAITVLRPLAIGVVFCACAAAAWSPLSTRFAPGSLFDASALVERVVRRSSGLPTDGADSPFATAVPLAMAFIAGKLLDNLYLSGAYYTERARRQHLRGQGAEHATQRHRMTQIALCAFPQTQRRLAWEMERYMWPYWRLRRVLVPLVHTLACCTFCIAACYLTSFLWAVLVEPHCTAPYAFSWRAWLPAALLPSPPPPPPTNIVSSMVAHFGLGDLLRLALVREVIVRGALLATPLVWLMITSVRVLFEWMRSLHDELRMRLYVVGLQVQNVQPTSEQ